MQNEDDDFFRRRTWGYFSPRKNIEFLLNGVDRFRDHKQITTKALSTWTVTGSQKYAKNAIKLEIVDTVSAAEKSASEYPHGNEIISDFVGRVNYLKPEFFSLAYYPIGGISTLSSMLSIGRHRKILSNKFRDIKSLIEFMRVCHYWYENLNDTRIYKRPSLSGVSQIVLDVVKWPDGSPSKRLRNDLRPYMGRAALIYAGSAIRLSNGDTITEAMLTHTLSYALLQPHVQTWVGYATFISDAILGNVVTIENQAEREDYIPQKYNKATLPDAAPIAFAMNPSFSSEASEEVKKRMIRGRFR